MKDSYQRGKEAARQYAIDKQAYIAESNLSYGELAEIQAELEKLGKRYGLIGEFKENGLI